ncbi:MAG: phosphoenolpyruvate carboxykinase (ATP), partial [Armatimonadetes bacterium]|nr:phosphoenolpyruvate carboxykinase (ATP) [Armatimonadota bacterium]
MAPKESGDIRRTMPTTIGHITIENFLHIFDEIVENKQRCGIEAIQNNPDDLLQRARSYGTQYKNSSWGWTSNIWSRSAQNTVVIDSEHELKNEHRTLMLKVLEQILCRPMIQVDANLGGPGSRAQMHCRLYCDPQYPDIPYRWQQICFPADPAEEPGATLYFIPQYLGNPPMPNDPGKLLQVIRFPNHDYTICTASSYQGEVKKAFLAHWIRYCYLQGGTGEHAACREFTVKTPDGEEERIVMGCWGLTGSGKSAHGMYVLNEQIYQLYKDEFGLDLSEICYDNYIKNDDVIGWFEHVVAGSERGSWTKTEGVDENQAGIYDAAMSAEALHENTEWDEDGNPSFDARLFQYHGMPNRNARSV